MINIYIYFATSPAAPTKCDDLVVFGMLQGVV